MPTETKERSADTGERSRERRKREDARNIFTAAAIGGLALAILVLAEIVEPAAALAGAGIGVVCIVALSLLALPSLDLQKHLSRVKAVNLGSLGLELGEYERQAKLDGKEEDDPPGADTGTDAAESLLGLRFRLEEKLAYLAKHVLAPDPDPSHLNANYLNIGSLRRDGLLGDEQARIAVDVLTMREFELNRLSERERQVFLRGANGVVDRIRVEVFAAHVRRELKRAKWRTFRVFDPPNRRRDIVVQSRIGDDGTQHHVIPVFTLIEESKLLERPLKRLQESPRAKCGGRRLIVIPPLSKAKASLPAGAEGVKVVTLAELLEALGG